MEWVKTISLENTADSKKIFFQVIFTGKLSISFWSTSSEMNQFNLIIPFQQNFHSNSLCLSGRLHTTTQC